MALRMAQLGDIFCALPGTWPKQKINFKN